MLHILGPVVGPLLLVVLVTTFLQDHFDPHLTDKKSTSR